MDGEPGNKHTARVVGAAGLAGSRVEAVSDAGLSTGALLEAGTAGLGAAVFTRAPLLGGLVAVGVAAHQRLPRHGHDGQAVGLSLDIGGRSVGSRGQEDHGGNGLVKHLGLCLIDPASMPKDWARNWYRFEERVEGCSQRVRGRARVVIVLRCCRYCC